MKIKNIAFTVLAGLAITSMSATAEIIYSETFDNPSGPLNGATTTEGGGTWIADSGLNHNGELPAQGKRLAYLPFTPEAGTVYTLSMDVDITGPADWLGFGFSELALGNSYFYQIGSAAWILQDTAGAVDLFLGPNATNPVDDGGYTASAGTNTLKIVLDTRDTLWTVAYYVDDNLLNTAAFAANPTINYVAFGKANGGLTGTVSNLSLSVAPKEPPTSGGTTFYSETFDNPSAGLNGQTPTIGDGTWIADPYLDHNGVLPVQGKQLMYLPFTPATGTVYTLSMDVDITGPADWIGFGFSELALGNAYFYQIGSAAWILQDTAGAVDLFLGPNATNPVDDGGYTASAGTNTLKIVLDTRDTLWTVAYYVDTNLLNTAAFAVNPTINYVAFGKANGGLTGKVSNLSLTIPQQVVSYSDWVNWYELTGSETNLVADLEPDGMDNLTEWMLGGHPLIADNASILQSSVDGGELVLSYKRRMAADLVGVEYSADTTDNLAGDSWTTNGVGETVTPFDTDFESVTNTVPADVAARFLGLTITSEPQSVTPPPPPPVDPTAYEVPFAATTPTIDGVLTGTEYDDAHVIHLEYPSVTNSGSFKYEAASSPDFAVDYYLKWDATYLYVCVVVEDDLTVFSENGTQAYPNDHMNIAIDPWRSGSGSGDIAFYEMFRSESGASTNTAVQYRAIGINNPAFAPDNALIDSSVQAGVGYTIEAAFAWTDLLGITAPAVGDEHRFLMFPADKDVDTPDSGGINDDGIGTFFWDGQGPGGTEANVGDPTTYVNITLADEL